MVMCLARLAEHGQYCEQNYFHEVSVTSSQ